MNNTELLIAVISLYEIYRENMKPIYAVKRNEYKRQKEQNKSNKHTFRDIDYGNRHHG